MIKLGLNNLKDITLGSTPVKKVMLGATLLWEKISNVVFSLQQFKDRVAADGGTYYDYDEASIVDDGQLLLLTPNAVKAGKIYSAIPANGSGDFTVADNELVSIDFPYIQVNVGRLVLGLADTFSKYGSMYINQDKSLTKPNGINDKVCEFRSASAQGATVIYKELGTNLSGDYTLTFYMTQTVAYDFAHISQYASYTNYTSHSSVIISTTAVDNGWVKHVMHATNLTPGIAYKVVFRDNGTGANRYVTGVMVQKGLINNETISTSSDDFMYGPHNFPGIVATVVPPAGTVSIYETVNDVETKITTIPSTYQIPGGNVNKIEMYPYSHNKIEWVTGNEVYDGEITTLEVNIN